MSIIVGGFNDYNQISQNSNSQAIAPPINKTFTFPDISYSVCYQHSVAVGQNNTPYALGNNEGNRVCGGVHKITKRWFEFHISENQNIYQVQSAVCGVSYTLYLLKVENPNFSPLAVVFSNYNNGHPTFLKTDGKKIVGIFGGCFHSAAIDDGGSIHIITEQNVKAVQSTIKAVLPESEIPIYVAFEANLVIALSRSGKVYQFDLMSNFKGNFTPVFELIGIPCSCISGIANHSLVVTSNGAVYGRGSNEKRQIGGKTNYPVYTQIKALSNQRIAAAYAGYSHSLFQNIDGRLFAVGSNQSGECLMANGNKEPIIPTPKPTIVLSGCRYCIVGCYLSVVFVNQNPPPCNPNLALQIKLSYRMMSEVGSESEREEAINNLNKQIQKKSVKIKSQEKMITELKNQLQTAQKKHKKELNQLKKSNEIELNKLKALYEKVVSENKNLKKQIKNYENKSFDDQYEYNDDDGDEQKDVALPSKKLAKVDDEGDNFAIKNETQNLNAEKNAAGGNDDMDMNEDHSGMDAHEEEDEDYDDNEEDKDDADDEFNNKKEDEKQANKIINKNEPIDDDDEDDDFDDNEDDAKVGNDEFNNKKEDEKQANKTINKNEPNDDNDDDDDFDDNEEDKDDADDEFNNKKDDAKQANKTINKNEPNDDDDNNGKKNAGDGFNNNEDDEKQANKNESNEDDDDDENDENQYDYDYDFS